MQILVNGNYKSPFLQLHTVKLCSNIFLWYRTGSNLVSDIDISTHQLGKQIYSCQILARFFGLSRKKIMPS
jgi:hypothetical protein